MSRWGVERTVFSIGEGKDRIDFDPPVTWGQAMQIAKVRTGKLPMRSADKTS